MYKLENNVAWTNELKDAFKNNITRSKIIYNNGTENIIINENNGLQKVSLEDNRYVPEVGFIGQATAKKATLTLLDNTQTTNLENKEIELYIGADYNNTTYYINFGKFIVNEPPKNDSTNGTISIVTYDYMIKFNKPYKNQVNYPCTLKALLQNICSQAEVELGSKSFINENFYVTDNQFEGKTLREVLQHICKCAFSWARIGQDNKLYIDFKVKYNVEDIEKIGPNDYYQDSYKKANEYYGPINKVIYGDSDITGQEESVEDEDSIANNGEKSFVINDNYFAYTAAKRQELIQGGSTLFGFTYMPITQLDLKGLIFLDSTDIIEVEDGEGNTIISRVFSHTIEYTGILKDSITNSGESKTEKTYKNTKKTSEENSKIGISVDRANKKITQIIEEIGDRSNKSTSITQDINGIQQLASNSVDYRRDVEGITEIHLGNAAQADILNLEIRGYETYISDLFPREDLYPSEGLSINMEGSELV